MKRKVVTGLIVLLVLAGGALWLSNSSEQHTDWTGSYLLPKLEMKFYVANKGGRYAAYYPRKNGHYEYRRAEQYSSASAKDLTLPIGGVLITELGVLATVQDKNSVSKEDVPEYQLLVYAGKTYDVYQISKLSDDIPDDLADGSAICDFRKKSLLCSELITIKEE